MSQNKNKTCSELLMTTGMGLDRAYFEFQKLVFFGTPINGRLTALSAFQKQPFKKQPSQPQFAHELDFFSLNVEIFHIIFLFYVFSPQLQHFLLGLNLNNNNSPHPFLRSVSGVQCEIWRACCGGFPLRCLGFLWVLFGGFSEVFLAVVGSL